ncbi:hypothetical protein ABFS82_13G074900 [Erythranthe guttata]
MAFQRNFGAPTMDFGSNGEVSHKQKWNSLSQSSMVAENLNGCFDCNICLDSSHDPVVTLCGHLYCWPCIYKWLQVQKSSSETDKRPKCPVCKSHISTSSLVPLYGRGMSDSEGKKPQFDLAIPHRPPALGVNALLASSDLNQRNNRSPLQFQPQNREFHQEQYFSHPFGGITSTSLSSPTVIMVGEMVFATIFGSSDTSLFAHRYSNSNSYTVYGNDSPRSRWLENEAHTSLNRRCIFLFCCLVLCLVLF